MKFKKEDETSFKPVNVTFTIENQDELNRLISIVGQHSCASFAAKYTTKEDIAVSKTFITGIYNELTR